MFPVPLPPLVSHPSRPLAPLPPLPLSNALASEVDLDGCSKEEMVRCLHWEEAEKLAALVQCGQLIQGMNQQLQEHLCKIRELKAIYGRLQAENRKLRNLCYFLDEDQLKAKCLASHWQIFGHHMAQVLRYEVASCLCKLAGLEGLLTPLSPLHHSGATNGVNLRGPPLQSYFATRNAIVGEDEDEPEGEVKHIISLESLRAHKRSTSNLP
ncbi:coiled-coil domain-containing protein 85B-like [Pseudonaja textilis]|uniref:coiled-coil domain-containing protein 85B-like n=1 Tax=Pseudonaja textilis TaxID=8673 RepID=UPI000EAABB65|nr:coiled-coil domain-containing protein 85B-like [Pseudonaja textilis]